VIDSNQDAFRPVSDPAIDYNILDGAYIENPLPTWDDLRRRCPIAHTERWGGSWLPTRYEDVQALAKMVPALSSRSSLVFDLPEELDSDLVTGPKGAAPLSSDPPEQTWTRKALLPHFTPKMAEAQRPFTTTVCADLIDSFIDDGRCDAASQYSEQITPKVITHMLGVNKDATHELIEWVKMILNLGLEGTEWTEYWSLIRDFFASEIQDRRFNPQDDLISKLTHTEVGGEAIPEEVVVGMCALQLVAGIDTTWSVISSAIWHFAAHPEDQQRIAADPSLWPTAIEELLRFYSPVTSGRNATRTIEYNEVTFQSGDKVLLNFPAANHDPEVFENPQIFMLDRKENRHIAFGVGIHRCTGANLARVEIEVALKTWFERIPRFSLEHPDAVCWAGGGTRGPTRVPVIFG
tara:strand:+ start:1023 stop:2243 length:1221 start_codon:yes stop_codon:yes gene_type:complete